MNFRSLLLIIVLISTVYSHGWTEEKNITCFQGNSKKCAFFAGFCWESNSGRLGDVSRMCPQGMTTCGAIKIHNVEKSENGTLQRKLRTIAYHCSHLTVKEADEERGYSEIPEFPDHYVCLNRSIEVCKPPNATICARNVGYRLHTTTVTLITVLYLIIY